MQLGSSCIWRRPVYRFPSFLPPTLDRKGGRRSPTLNKEEEGRPEKRKPQPPPRSPSQPLARGSLCACACARAGSTPPATGDKGTRPGWGRGRPKAVDPWKSQVWEQGDLQERSQVHSLRAGDGWPRHTESSKRESSVQEPITLPSTRSQQPPDRGSIRFSGAANGPA